MSPFPSSKLHFRQMLDLSKEDLKLPSGEVVAQKVEVALQGVSPLVLDFLAKQFGFDQPYLEACL